jgi:cAMP-dependent protein kinase regulator
MSVGKEHQAYMKSKVDSFLHQFTSKAITEKPTNLNVYLYEYLKELLGLKLSESEHEELLSLRKLIKNLNKGKGSSSESQSEDDEIEELPLLTKPKAANARSSVSAEVFGNWNKKEDFHPRVIQKSESQKLKITERLNKSFMFAALDHNEINIIVDAMEEKNFVSGETVIKQGDEGNELFVVESGKLECSKVFKDTETPTFLKSYHPGEAFGELALLYNAPRAATIVVSEDCKCWVLDRQTFNHIVKDAAARKRDKYQGFLSEVELIKGIDAYERLQIADALKDCKFNSGDYVIRQGDWGDVFYIIEQGTAVAKKVFFTGGPEVQVKEYQAGDYFGELALLKGEPRAASIIATSQLKCVSLNRKAFKRMFGPLDEVLRRNAGNYKTSAT